MAGAAFRASELWFQGGKSSGLGGLEVAGSEGTGWEMVESKPRLESNLQITQSNPAAPQKGPGEGWSSSLSLPLAFLCRDNSSPPNVLMWELFPAEICLPCKTQRKFVLEPEPRRSQPRAGTREDQRDGRITGMAGSQGWKDHRDGSSGDAPTAAPKKCPGVGRSRPSAFPSQVLRKHQIPH